MPHALAALGRALRAASLDLRDPHLWVPAAVLLLPTLALQLAIPEWLRSRLSPSLWTVIAGSLLIIFLTQVAAAASWGWVHARRHRQRVRGCALLRDASRVGSLTTLGLLAGVLPGLWLQAGLASEPLQLRDHANPAAPPQRGPLLALAGVTLIVSVLGQSLAAGLAEALGTITPQATVDGRDQFRLAYAPHLLTSLLAYAWTTLALTLQAIVVSRLHTDAPLASMPAARQRPTASPIQRRMAMVGAALVLLAGAIAAVQKVQQHVY